MLRIAVTCTLLAACTNPHVTPSPDAAPSMVVLASLTDTCGGIATLTGQEALELLGPAYSATYTPVPSGTSSTLSLAATYDAGQIICHGPQSIEAEMAPSIELAVHASVSTSDGTFDEHFDAAITLSSDSESSLGFLGTVPITSLQGSYQPAISGGWATHVVSFGGTLDPGHTTNGLAEEQASNLDRGQVTGAGSWR